LPSTAAKDQHQQEDRRLDLEIAIAQPAGVVLVRHGRPGGLAVEQTERTLGHEALLKGARGPSKHESGDPRRSCLIAV